MGGRQLLGGYIISNLKGPAVQRIAGPNLLVYALE
jgi:hypothetical protein